MRYRNRHSNRGAGVHIFVDQGEDCAGGCMERKGWGMGQGRGGRGEGRGPGVLDEAMAEAAVEAWVAAGGARWTMVTYAS